MSRYEDRDVSPRSSRRDGRSSTCRVSSRSMSPAMRRSSSHRDSSPAVHRSSSRRDSVDYRDRERDRAPSRSDSRRPSSTATTFCYHFNNQGKCWHNDRCYYRHACSTCRSTSHGASKCPLKASSKNQPLGSSSVVASNQGGGSRSATIGSAKTPTGHLPADAQPRHDAPDASKSAVVSGNQAESMEEGQMLASQPDNDVQAS